MRESNPAIPWHCGIDNARSVQLLCRGLASAMPRHCSCTYPAMPARNAARNACIASSIACNAVTLGLQSRDIAAAMPATPATPSCNSPHPCTKSCNACTPGPSLSGERVPRNPWRFPTPRPTFSGLIWSLIDRRPPSQPSDAKAQHGQQPRHSPNNPVRIHHGPPLPHNRRWQSFKTLSGTHIIVGSTYGRKHRRWRLSI